MGIVLALLLVEIGFRAAGGLLLLGRESKNRQGLGEGTYRILCLGESTTQEQWPPLLQEKLDKSNAGVAFKVIDKGKKGTSSAIILSLIDDYLTTYKPQAVVVMMGINDSLWIWKNTIELEKKPLTKFRLWAKNCRLNKLSTYIVDGFQNRKRGHAQNKTEPPTVSFPFYPAPHRPIDIMMRASSLKNPSSHMDWGKWHRKNGDHIKAAESFKEAINSDPRNVQAYIELGNLSLEENDYEAAERTYLDGIKANPSDGNLFVELGTLYFINGEHQKSHAAFESGVKAGRGNDWILVALGDLYHREGKLDDAEQIYSTVVKTDPKNGWVYAQLIKLHEDRALHGQGVDPVKFEQMYRTGMLADPRNQLPYVGLGRLFQEKGSNHKAEESFRSGIKADPANPQAYIELGNLYTRRGSTERAESIIKSGIKAAPHEPSLYTALGDLYRERGDYRKAEFLLKQAISANPSNPGFYVELVNLYFAMGEDSKAGALCETAMQAYPDNPWIFLELGKAYMLRGDGRNAELILLRGQKSVGANPAISGLLSMLSIAMGHKDTGAGRHPLSYPPLGTIRNYQKLRDRVLASGAKLICVQYPMRDVKILEEILGTDKGIVYVDNKSDFETALRENKVTDVFLDLFAGDFGHCTPLGNSIIADNVAEAILTKT